MAKVQATMERSVDEAREAVLLTAADQGWRFAPAESLVDVLVLTRGMGGSSWGSRMTVQLQASTPSSTDLTLITGEALGVADWWRGRRIIRRLLEQLGARETPAR